MPSIALPVSLRGQLLSGTGSSVVPPAFSPADLFATGSQGIWLDPSDLSTMFSDRAGTTPVTTPGTVVGLRLDKSKGLVLGAELVTEAQQDGANSSSDNYAYVLETISGVQVGKTYRFSYRARVTGDAAQFTQSGFGDDINVSQNTSWDIVARRALSTSFVTYDGIFTAPSTALEFGIRAYPVTIGTTTVTVEYDSLTVRELPGNHAVAPTDAARPIYGIEPAGGRRNLVIVSEPTKAQVTASTAGVTDAAAFGTFARSLQFPSGASAEYTYLAGEAGWVSGVTATVSVYVRMDDGLAPVFGSAVTSNVANDFAIVTRGALTPPDTFTVTDVGGGIYRVSTTGTTGTNASNSGVTRFATNSGRGFRVTGYTLELGSAATPYQRVTTAFDVTEAGVQTCHYVQYDGSDDSMSTAAIDFTATDKMSVFAGVRKNVDSPTGMIAELSTDASALGAFGSFFFLAGTNAGGVYSSLSRGSAAAAAGQATFTTAGAAPDAAVLTVTHDIPGDLSTIRRNGVAGTSATADKGTGNFGNYPLYVGRRNNATLPFNGRDYGIIIVGKAASAGEITDTELWLSDKTSEVDVAKSISPNIYTRSGDTILDRANSIIERRTV